MLNYSGFTQARVLAPRAVRAAQRGYNRRADGESTALDVGRLGLVPGQRPSDISAPSCRRPPPAGPEHPTLSQAVVFVADAAPNQTIAVASLTNGPVRTGDAVAVDPQTNDLIVEQFDSKGARLVRLDPTRGREQPVSFQGDVFLALFPMSSMAV